MPTSDYRQIVSVLDHILSISPTTILEIGIGFGKWGLLCREYLDIWNGRYAQKEWKTKIYGIEIYEKYHNPVWDYVYDEVIIGNALENIDKFFNIDLIIMTDVIEHLEKDMGIALIEKCVRISKKVLITTPKEFFINDYTQNIFEKHQSHWKLSDFKKFSFIYEEAPSTIICVIEKPAVKPIHRFVLSPLEREPLRRIPGIVAKKVMKKIRQFFK